MKYTISKIDKLMLFLDDKLKTNDKALREVVRNELLEIAITAKEEGIEEIHANQRDSIEQLRKNKI